MAAHNCIEFNAMKQAIKRHGRPPGRRCNSRRSPPLPSLEKMFCSLGAYILLSLQVGAFYLQFSSYMGCFYHVELFCHFSPGGGGGAFLSLPTPPPPTNISAGAHGTRYSRDFITFYT